MFSQYTLHPQEGQKVLPSGICLPHCEQNIVFLPLKFSVRHFLILMYQNSELLRQHICQKCSFPGLSYFRIILAHKKQYCPAFRWVAYKMRRITYILLYQKKRHTTIGDEPRSSFYMHPIPVIHPIFISKDDPFPFRK